MQRPLGDRWLTGAGHLIEFLASTCGSADIRACRTAHQGNSDRHSSIPVVGLLAAQRSPRRPSRSAGVQLGPLRPYLQFLASGRPTTPIWCRQSFQGSWPAGRCGREPSRRVAEIFVGWHPRGLRDVSPGRHRLLRQLYNFVPAFVKSILLPFKRSTEPRIH